MAFINDEKSKLFISFEEGTSIVRGYVLGGPCGLPHEEVTPECGEIVKLYVSESEFGSGLAHDLMRTAMDWLLKENSDRKIWLGVYSDNIRAIKFYRKFGFNHVGEYEFEVGTCRDREWILRN